MADKQNMTSPPTPESRPEKTPDGLESNETKQNVSQRDLATGSVAVPSSRGRWIVGLIARPLLFFCAGTALLVLLGLAQRLGWISAGGDGGASHATTRAAQVDYICPMMCTPPQQEPGRCPVCAMELVPAAAGGAGGDERSVVVDPASRRVANIQTVAVRSASLTRTIGAVGEVQYDEGTLKTISAYTDGRFDALYVDFTGAVVKEGDRLASFYSPELYSAQVEYLQTAKSVRAQAATSLASVADANRRLRDNSRQRLIELGMSESQIAQLEKQGHAQSRMDIVAPMSGTVIEKLAVEGEYVKEGQPVFRLADLSTVWLMLELFPEQAAVIREGQTIEATFKSQPGRLVSGRIAFIDPHVDSKSRTVRVRVVIDNHDDALRIGDYAKASIQIPISHPENQNTRTAVTVPRNAVLRAADQSVVYVETEPGRFEIRRVVTGATTRREIVIVTGLAEGETVATSGNFLLDSQMQLAGNPSLIDPARAAPPMDIVPGMSPEMLVEINKLPEADRELAKAQMICPVTDFALGSMGVPPKVMVEGQVIFLCCEGCRESLLDNPKVYLAHLEAYHGGVTGGVSDSQDGLPPMGTMESATFEPKLPPFGDIELLPSGAEPMKQIQRSADGSPQTTEAIR